MPGTLVTRILRFYKSPAGASDSSLLATVQTGSGALPLCYAKGTGRSFPGRKEART
jgi:hypothetical protein